MILQLASGIFAILQSATYVPSPRSSYINFQLCADKACVQALGSVNKSAVIDPTKDIPSQIVAQVTASKKNKAGAETNSFVGASLVQ